MSQNYKNLKKYDQYNTKFSFNNSEEFEFDAYNADDAERFENAVEMLRVEEPKVPLIGKLSVRIKAEYALYEHFFDMVLGKGAFEKIMQGKKSTTLFTNCYIAFLDFVAKQKDVMIANKNKTVLSQKKSKQNTATVKVAKAKK